MSAMSLRMIDTRAEHCRQVDYKWSVARTLTKAVRKSLSVDTHHRVEIVQEEIGACLKTKKWMPSDLQGGY